MVQLYCITAQGLDSAYCLCGISSLYLCVLFPSLRLPPTFQKHAGMWIGDSNLPLGVNECVHGVL